MVTEAPAARVPIASATLPPLLMVAVASVLLLMNQLRWDESGGREFRLRLKAVPGPPLLTVTVHVTWWVELTVRLPVLVMVCFNDTATSEALALSLPGALPM